MAVTITNPAYGSDTTNNVLTVVGPTVNAGSNRVLVIIIEIINQSGTPPSVSGNVVRGAQVFTELTAARQTWENAYTGRGKIFVYYALEASIASGSGNIVANFSSDFDIGYMSYFVAQDAYQGASAHYGFDSADSSIVPVSIDLFDTQSGAKIIYTGHTMEIGTAGSAYPNIFDLVGGIGGAFESIGSLPDPPYTGSFPERSHLHEGGSGNSADGTHTVGFDWQNNTNAADMPSDVVFFAIEINTSDWTPPVAGVSSVGMCEYVSQGQVREMVTAISGLDHLEGEEVLVQADGLPEDSQTYSVVDGDLTPELPNKKAVVHAGLGYDGILKLLKASDGSATGTGQMKMRRIYLTGIRVYRSNDFKIGLDEDHLKKVIGGTPSLPNRTEDLKKLPETTWREDAQLLIKQDRPMPLFILAIIAKSEVEES